MLSHLTVLVQFYIFTSHYLSMHIYYYQKQTTPKKGRDIIPDILSLKTTRAFWRQNTLILISPRLLAPNYLEHFIGSAPPLFILDPLLWIGSAYSFVYLNSCLWLNKLLTNLTSSRQHHLQYTIIQFHYKKHKLSKIVYFKFGLLKLKFQLKISWTTIQKVSKVMKPNFLFSLLC
jgi:hypothetical protein